MGLVAILGLTLALLVCPCAMSMGWAETLEDAWNVVLDVNHIARSAKYSANAAHEAVRATRAERFPNVAASAGYTALDNEPAATTDIAGSTVEFPTAESAAAAYKAAATVPIFTSGRISHDIEAAEASWSAARSQEKIVVQDLKLGTAAAYVTVLHTTSALEVARSYVTSLRSHMRDVQHRYGEGMVPRNDLLAAEVSLADARQESLQISNRLEVARADYNRLLGRSLDQAVVLDPLVAEIVTESLASLTQRALQNRSEVAVLRSRIRAFRAQAASIRASTLPQITLSGGYDFQQNKYQVHEGAWFSKAGVEWRLFDAGVVRHRASSEEQQAQALAEQLADLLAGIRAGVRHAWLDVGETGKRIEVTKKALAAADENLRVSRDRYNSGLSTNTEVLDAETLRARSRYNHTNAVYDAVLAVLRLRRAVGEL